MGTKEIESKDRIVHLDDTSTFIIWVASHDETRGKLVVCLGAQDGYYIALKAWTNTAIEWSNNREQGADFFYKDATDAIFLGKAVLYQVLPCAPPTLTKAKELLGI